MGFIDFIKEWIKSISIVFILVSIIEIIIPNNNFKRYINMVVGFLIIIAIITPFISIIDKSYDIEKEIFKNIMEGIKIQNPDNDEVIITQENHIKEMYINKLKEDITEEIKQVTEYEITNLNITIFEDEKNFGNIKNIELVLNDKEDENIEKDNSIKVINIEEISIDNSKKDDKDSELLMEKEKILELLNAKYNLQEDNIRVLIKTMKEGEHSGKSD